MFLNRLLLPLLLSGLPGILSAQRLDALVRGSWLEAYRKTGHYYLPLNIQLNPDGTARYPDRYPEQSYRLFYRVTPDSQLQLTNGRQYKIIRISPTRLQLKELGVKKPKLLLLRRAVPGSPAVRRRTY